MTTERLYEFCVLAKTLNYSKAASRLFLTQATLSRHIMDLEKEIGVPLFIRDTHSVSLTESGKILFQKTIGFLENVDTVINHIRIDNIKTAGKVNLACLEISNHDKFQYFISSFASNFPSIDCNLDFYHASDIGNIPDKYDLLFSIFDIPIKNYQILYTFQSPCILAANRNHHIVITKSFVNSQSIFLRNLKGENLIVPFSEITFNSFSSTMESAIIMTGKKINIIKTSSIENALSMITLGKGVGIFPELGQTYNDSSMLHIAIKDADCIFNTYVYINKENENPAARLMLDEFNTFFNSGRLSEPV